MKYHEFFNEVKNRVQEYYPNECVELDKKTGNNGAIINILFIGEEQEGKIGIISISKSKRKNQ